MNPDRSASDDEPVTAEVVLSAFEDASGDVVRLDDVTESLGCSAEAAERALRDLERQDVVECWELGAGRAWCLTRDVEPYELSYDSDPADEHYSSEDSGNFALFYEWAMQ